MNFLYRNFLGLACLVFAFSSHAQDDAFDLGSQRGEVQQFNRVPGHKVDHKGIVINPTPQSIERSGNIAFNPQQGFNVKDKQKAFDSDLSFLNLNPKGIKLNIDYGPNQAKKAGVKEVSGAYLLDITPKGIDIIGYDNAGAFYALQTLRQILQSEATLSAGIPEMKINDFPDLPYRGVVEGFYGTPWSHEVRLSLIDFYGKNKMNNYIFGPKDDPYHSSPNWRKPYPADEAQKIHELVEASKRNHVNFVWAIHPGKDIRWNKEDYDSLVNKFNMMYDLGVRAFAIFFDDIEGIGTDSNMQVDLLNNLTKDFVKAKGDVANLMICPTDYSALWANPNPDGQLAIYGNKLNPDVEVFWTGDVVCSDLTPSTLEFVDSRIKRPALYWWNFPVTDYARHIMMQGPVYGLDTTLTSDQVIGIESNPMEHGEASKLALYGVADWAWNIEDYNAIDNWERGLVELMPSAADAYRTFAIHSTDTETGYRRDESWETEIFPFNNYTPSQFEALKSEFEKVAAVPAIMEQNCDNELLLGELRPWLVEFGKLGQRGLNALELIKIYEKGDYPTFWANYIDNLMTTKQREEYNAHKSGTMKLQPFYDNTMDDLLVAFFKNVSGEVPMMPHAVGTYPSLRTTQQKLMLDNDTTTHYTSGRSQGKGDWMGLDLGAVRNVESVLIHQGRNSVNDGDYYERAILEASIDGKNWKALSDSLERTYIISYEGEAVPARFVRLRRLDSDKRSWAAIRSFVVNPPTPQRIGLNISSSNPQGALLAFDSNPSSFYKNEGILQFDKKPESENLILMLSDINSPLTLTQIDSKGNDLETITITQPFTEVPLSPQASRLKLNGEVTIYEIIQK